MLLQLKELSESGPARLARSKLKASLPWLFLIWQAGWLMHFASTADWCCDAGYYLVAGQDFWTQGLGYPDRYAGYRPYLTPLMVGAFAQFPVSPEIFVDQRLAYSINVALSFFAVSSGLTILLADRMSRREWSLISLPTLFNPYFLANLVVPLQEVPTLFVGLPLLTMIAAALLARRFERAAFLVVSLAAIVSFARTQNAIVAAPAGVLCLFLFFALRHDRRRRLRLAFAVAGGIVVAALLSLPQLAIHRHHFGTWASPRSADMANFQLEHGADLSRYGTALINNQWQGVRISGPWFDYDMGASYAHPYQHAGWLAVPHVLTHVFLGLHVDEPRTYWSRGLPAALGAWLIVSALIVFLGAVGIARDLRRSPAVGWTLLSLLLVSCAYTALLAVETRFGLWGQIALAMGAARLLFAQPRMHRTGAMALLALGYVVLAAAFNGWIWSYA